MDKQNQKNDIQTVGTEMFVTKVESYQAYEMTVEINKAKIACLCLLYTIYGEYIVDIYMSLNDRYHMQHITGTRFLATTSNSNTEKLIEKLKPIVSAYALEFLPELIRYEELRNDGNDKGNSKTKHAYDRSYLYKAANRILEGD